MAGNVDVVLVFLGLLWRHLDRIIGVCFLFDDASAVMIEAPIVPEPPATATRIVLGGLNVGMPAVMYDATIIYMAVISIVRS